MSGTDPSGMAARGRRLTGRPHRTIGAASAATGSRHRVVTRAGRRRRNFPGGPDVLAATIPAGIATGVFVRLSEPRPSRHSRVSPWPRSSSRRSSWRSATPASRSDRRRPRRRRRRAHDGGAASCSTATPASGRGWPSTSTSRTTARPIAGELRLAGGARAGRGSGPPVDLPTQSDKIYRLYAQPPAFGREVEISLVDGASTIATTKAAFTVHDAAQLVVGVVAERPGEIIGGLDLLPNPNNVAPLTVGLGAGRPARTGRGVEHPRPPDLAGHRLVTPDADQLEALRGWIAGGGRLIIVGGTAGPRQPVGLPRRHPALPPDRDDRRRAGVRSGPCSASSRRTPPTCRRCPASSIGGTGARRRSATAWSPPSARTAAARSPIIGFDPTADWIAGTRIAEGLWRRLLPTRAAGGPVVGDDSQIVSGRVPAAVARAAADRRPDRAAGRVHPAHRPDQLPRPAAPRPARMGVGHDAVADRRVRGRGLRVRLVAARQRRHRQRGRHRPRRARRDRGRRPGLPRACSRRHAARTRSGVPGRRPPLVTDQRRPSAATARARPSTSCRAIRRASATSGSGSARCAPSGPRPR